MQTVLECSVANLGYTMNAYALTITASSEYLLEQSKSELGRFAFAYTMTIRNIGALATQLIARYWQITDTEGYTQTISGLGVIGHQPLLQPNEQFEYTSWATIATPVGTMQGHYFCVAEDGTRFEAPIPPFILSMPRVLH